MYGLEAISASNGWAISVVGISIVFTGLVSLSALISQLHKLVDLFDNPGKIKNLFAPKGVPGAQDDSLEQTPVLSEGEKQVCREYGLLAGTMGAEISLPGLLRRAELSGLKDPHANMHILLKTGVLTSNENGYFSWDQARFSLISR